MNRLLSIEEKLKIIDEIETIFVTGKGMPTSGHDEIFKKLKALKTDQQERTVDVTGGIKNGLVEEIKDSFYIRYLIDSEDGDEATTNMLELVIGNSISKLK